jgi:oxygen-independent coproporphyrinogen-3 oxidase
MRLPSIDPSLLARYDIAGPRYTSYPTVPVWRDDIGPSDYVRALESASAHADRPLSMYVHLPFCEEHCAYCGCNVVITQDRSRADRYLDHLARELEMVAERLGPRRSLAQIHWGGGTPTFLDEVQLERLWREITSRFTPRADAEIAIEIDPMVTSEAQLALLHGFGFNRISLGVQDFDPKVQEAVRRPQSVSRTLELTEIARRLGFSGVNYDLIYGLPFQTPETWGRTLERVLELAPDRLAIYSFAYLPDLRKQQRKLPVFGLPSGTEKLALFTQAYQTLTDAGYVSIGMDHFASPSDELARAQKDRRLGRNFQGYTVQAAEDTIAFGVSGIGSVDGLYAQNVRGLSHYYERIERGELATTKGLWTTAEDRSRAGVINALMCNHEVDLGADAERRYARELAALRAMETDELLTLQGPKVELTVLGRLLVRNVAMVFDAYLESTEAAFSRTV